MQGKDSGLCFSKGVQINSWLKRAEPKLEFTVMMKLQALKFQGTKPASEFLFLFLIFSKASLPVKNKYFLFISDAYFWCSFLTEKSISARHKGFGVRILWFQIFTYKLGKLSISRFCVLSVKNKILLLVIFNNFTVFVLLRQGLNELLQKKKARQGDPSSCLVHLGIMQREKLELAWSSVWLQLCFLTYGALRIRAPSLLSPSLLP